MYNVIFLDLDGVVNSDKFRKERKSKSIQFSREQLKMISDFAYKYECKIVISASIRKINTVKSLQVLLEGYGFESKIFGFTKTSVCNVRGYEIDKWIKEHEGLVKNYIILDDSSDMLLGQARHYFRVDPSVGITESVLYRAGRFLRGELDL